MGWEDTLDFLYGRNAQENPRPQDPTVFSVPCDEFFHIKFQNEIARYRKGEGTPEALKEAINQLINHTSIPLAAYAFWKDTKLLSCIIGFFQECTDGKHAEDKHHWTSRIVQAFVKLVDTRGGVSTLETLQQEQADMILMFLLDKSTRFPPLWRILREISYTMGLLRGYEENVISTGTFYMSSILSGFHSLQSRFEEDKATHFTLPEHRHIQQQIDHLQYVFPSIYNVLLINGEALELVTDTAPSTFLDIFKQMYDLFVIALEYGFHPTEESVAEMNIFIANVTMYDCSSSLSFSTGTLPRNLIILFNDFSVRIAGSAALAFGRICSSNAAVHSIWETLMFQDNMSSVVRGFKTGLLHTNDEFRESSCRALLSMLDGPFRVKKIEFKDIIFDSDVAARNQEDPNYKDLCTLFT